MCNSSSESSLSDNTDKGRARQCKARHDNARQDNQKTTCSLSNTLLGQRPSELDFTYCLVWLLANLILSIAWVSQCFCRDGRNQAKTRQGVTRQGKITKKTTCSLSNTFVGQRLSKFDFIDFLGTDVFLQSHGQCIMHR